jgi:hypothetical protein
MPAVGQRGKQVRGLVTPKLLKGRMSDKIIYRQVYVHERP